MPTPSSTHLVVIPSYNTGGRRLLQTVTDALECWAPVWVVIDGSDDGSEGSLSALREKVDSTRLRVIQREKNGGKGAAVFTALRDAREEGFTHFLAMDADGQHPAGKIHEFMETSRAQPDAMILGEPVFDASAPAIRLKGRRISNGWVNLETLWGGIHDSLFGFRVYPVGMTFRLMRSHRWMRRFDFDPEIVVRLFWKGFRPVNLPVPAVYLTAEMGGVSHFNYIRDNVILTWMHTRLVLLGWLPRLPRLLWRKFFSKHPPNS